MTFKELKGGWGKKQHPNTLYLKKKSWNIVFGEEFSCSRIFAFRGRSWDLAPTTNETLSTTNRHITEGCRMSATGNDERKQINKNFLGKTGVEPIRNNYQGLRKLCEWILTYAWGLVGVNVLRTEGRIRSTSGRHPACLYSRLSQPTLVGSKPLISLPTLPFLLLF
jgi:hypothetical protein